MVNKKSFLDSYNYEPIQVKFHKGGFKNLRVEPVELCKVRPIKQKELASVTSQDGNSPKSHSQCV